MTESYSDRIIQEFGADPTLYGETVGLITYLDTRFGRFDESTWKKKVFIFDFRGVKYVVRRPYPTRLSVEGIYEADQFIDLDWSDKSETNSLIWDFLDKVGKNSVN